MGVDETFAYGAALFGVRLPSLTILHLSAPGAWCALELGEIFVSGKRTGFGSKFSNFVNVDQTKTVGSAALRRFQRYTEVREVDVP